MTVMTCADVLAGGAPADRPVTFRGVHAPRLEGQGERERRIGAGAVLGTGLLPQWRAAGRRDPGWHYRFARVSQDGPDRGRLGDKRDDAHRTITGRTHEWESIVRNNSRQLIAAFDSAAVRIGTVGVSDRPEADVS